MWSDVKKIFLSKGTQKDCDSFKEIQKIFADYPFEKILKEPDMFKLSISGVIPNIDKLYKAEINNYMMAVKANNDDFNMKNPSQPQRSPDFGLDLSDENLVVILKTAINNEISKIKKLCNSHLLSKSGSLQTGGAVKKYKRKLPVKPKRKVPVTKKVMSKRK